MIKEHFRDVGQILTVLRMDGTVNFKHSDTIMSVDFVPRRTTELQFGALVSNELLFGEEELQRKLAEIELHNVGGEHMGQNRVG